MKITNYFSFAVALVEVTLILSIRSLPVVAAFAFFTAFAALFYAAAIGAIYLLVG
jgi:hypothetical protein